MEMECSIYISRLNDFADGAVTDSEKQAMEEHASGCDQCRAERDGLLTLLDGLSDMGDEDVPAALHTGVMAAVKDMHRRKRNAFLMKVGGCAAAALLLVAIPIALSGRANLNYTGGSYAAYDVAPSMQAPQADMLAKSETAAYGNSDSGAIMNDTMALRMAAGEEGVSTESMPQEAYDMEAPAPAAMPTTAPSSGGGTELFATNATTAAREAKRILSGSISISSKSFDQDQRVILETVDEIGGYVENSYTWGLPLAEAPENGGRSVSLSVRIPSTAFDTFMERLGGIGQTDWSSQNSQDITDQYYDTQTRLDTLRLQYERLTDILSKSSELKDVLALETEMARVQYEVESLAGTLRHWDSQVTYSSINIELREVPKLERVTPVDPTLPERMYEGLIHTLNGIVKFLENALVFVVSALPIILALALACTVIIVVVRGRRVRRKMQDPGKPPRMD